MYILYISCRGVSLEEKPIDTMRRAVAIVHAPASICRQLREPNNMTVFELENVLQSDSSSKIFLERIVPNDSEERLRQSCPHVVITY